MPTARFLQISDLHLGAPFGWLPVAKRRERRREQQAALEAAVGLALSRRADALLVPGDLFDRDGADAESLAFAVHAFANPGCPPVFIAPGNHDPASASSRCWSPRLLAARGWAWPAHVHVFESSRWASRRLPGHPIRIWGRNFSAGIASLERPLAPEALAEISGSGELHVAVFHGAREGACPPYQTVTAPFSDDEALRTQFTYLAVGHYHWPSRLEDGVPTSVRLAYAGSLVAATVTEIGAHGALEVRLSYGQGPARVELEPLPLDPRRVHDVAIDVTGASGADQIERRIAAALDLAGVTELDIVTVRLGGRLMRGVRLAPPGADLDRRAFHLRIDARAVRPDYDLSAWRDEPARSTEDRFVQALLGRLDHEEDPEARAVVEGAITYGLDAFRLREVTPADEELSA